MSDIGIGKIIETEGAARDAIHVAVAPVEAASRLYPGQPIGLAPDGRATSNADLIGVVDPFLAEPVTRGQKFWLFLYPNTVTLLRHEWAHPAFGSNQAATGPKAASEAWLREFAEDVGLSYGVLMQAADEHLACGEYYILNHDTPDRVYADREKLWTHYEVVTGRKVEDRDATFISCSC